VFIDQVIKEFAPGAAAFFVGSQTDKEGERVGCLGRAIASSFRVKKLAVKGSLNFGGQSVISLGLGLPVD